MVSRESIINSCDRNIYFCSVVHTTFIVVSFTGCLSHTLSRPFCCRIQELDGGFFERFGSLGQKEQQAAPEDDPEPPQDDVEEEAVKKEIKKDLLAEAIGLNVSGVVLTD